MIDDIRAREARAKKIRGEIKELVDQANHGSEVAHAPNKKPTESPRDFIQRRMRELDDDKKDT